MIDCGRLARRDRLRVGRRGIRIDVDNPAADRTVDVEVDGHRMWTAELPEAGGRRTTIAWPTVLQSHVAGACTIVLRDQRSGRALAEGRLDLRGGSGATSLPELAKSRQIVDKWGKLTDAPSGALHRRLVAGMRSVLGDLDELGYTVAVTGGTLLGAVREGGILAHDDDIDLLVYLGEVGPADVSIASYAIERRIRERGHEVIRHSDAHLQVMFPDPAVPDRSAAAVHVDLFLGFHDNGVYNQPIAVRGRFEPESLLPLGEVTLEGAPVPSVADGEAWLELCYGPAWRTPDPSFRFRTAASTRRRFENWFGVYDLNRDFWERHIRLGRSRHWHADAELMLEKTAPGDRIIDLGCGDGELAGVLAAQGRQVVAVDYARAALSAAAARPGVFVQRLNLADRRAVLEFIADELQRGGTPHFLLSNVLHSLTRESRANTFLLLRALLDDDSVALASFTPNTSFVYDHFKPDTWHLPLRWLRAEASAHDLDFTIESRRIRPTASGRRNVVTARLYSTRSTSFRAREETR